VSVICTWLIENGKTMVLLSLDFIGALNDIPGLLTFEINSAATPLFHAPDSALKK
jgi:hypothetical protein